MKSLLALEEKGFSLVEIIVAMALLSLFIAVSVPLFSGIFGNIMWVGEKSKVTYDAQQIMEEGPKDGGSGTIEIVFEVGESETRTISLEVERFIDDLERDYLDKALRTEIEYFAIGSGNGIGNGFGAKPQDYVMHSGGGGTFSVPSGGNIEGSVYGSIVTIESAGYQINGNIISETSVVLEGGDLQAIVDGNICALDGDVTLSSGNTQVTGDIRASGNVTLGTSTVVLGTIFSGGDVTLKSHNAQVVGDIHATGNVTLENGTTVTGNTYAGEIIELKSINATINGDAHAGGNVILGSSATVTGNIYAGGVVNVGSNVTVGNVYENQSTPPRIEPTHPIFCIDGPIPPPLTQNFTISHDVENPVVPQDGSILIESGEYGTLTINGNSTTTFQGGTYYFKRIDGSQNQQKLRLDLSSDEEIHIFVEEEIIFAGTVEVSTNGTDWTRIRDLEPEEAEILAREVYWEVHGNYTTANQTPRDWFGTVLSTGRVELRSDAWIIGAFAVTGENGEFSIEANPTIKYVIADFARENW